MSCKRILSVAFMVTTALISERALAQTSEATQAPHRRFPYAFSNFVWWNDADLRSALKRRIPSLGEELTEGSQEQTKVRTMLVELLKEKGVDAEVQALYPSYDVLSTKRVPEAPPPSIIFSVASPPDILIDRVVLDSPPQDISDALNSAVNQMQGRPYAFTSFWADAQRMKQGLAQVGYLSAHVEFQPGTPRKENDRYLVSVNALITAGPKYRVSRVKGDGGPLLQGKDLSPYFSLKPGDVATPFAFGRLMGSLRSTYWHAGYPDIELQGDPVLDAAHALASYQLVVSPGPLYHLRSVKLENLNGAQETQARDMLGMKEGDVYDALAAATLNSKFLREGSTLKGYGVSYNAREDKQAHVIDLTLSFYKQ